MPSHQELIDKCHQAFWSFPEHGLGSDNRIAAVLDVIASHPLLSKESRLLLRQASTRTAMPDIAMCNGDDCPVKEQCWRYMAPADRFQSYFAAPPCDDDGCEYFWNIDEK